MAIYRSIVFLQITRLYQVNVCAAQTYGYSFLTVILLQNISQSLIWGLSSKSSVTTSRPAHRFREPPGAADGRDATE